MPDLVVHQGIWALDKTVQDLTSVVWGMHIEFKKKHWFGLFANGFEKALGKKVQHGTLESLQKELNVTVTL